MKLLLFLLLLPIAISAHNKPIYESADGNWAHTTLERLSLREKIGQLFIVATASCFEQQEEVLASAMQKCPYKMEPEHIRKLIADCGIGGLIFLYKSTPEKQIDAINEYQQLSKVPLLIGQDCEWGLSMRLYDTVRFPRNMTLGALRNKDLVYQFAREVGRQCKTLGVDINFAPVGDVNNRPENPVIGDRSFGQNADAVAYASSLVMQGLHDEGVLACAKHFPGHGDTDVDSHLDLPVIRHNKEQLERTELVPFKKLIAQRIGAVMSAHLAIPALEPESHRPSSLSRAIVTDLLQQQMGFQGLKITDGLGMNAITDHYRPGDIELQAFLAGNDIILCPLDVPKAIDAIERAIHSGIVSEQELNTRVLKILKAKEWTGRHRRPLIDKQAALAQLHTPHAYALKKQLYQQAVTAVDNTQSIPVSAPTIAYVQVGSTAPTVLQKTIEHECAKHRISMSTVEDANTVIVGIFGMNKFAQQQYGIAAQTLALINQLISAGKRVIVVPLGTPYSLRYFKDAAAVVVGYEDDPDAQEAAAAIIFGSRNAQGKLPVSV